MGQAKLRGTFEQRQADGIAKRRAEELKQAEQLRLERKQRAEQLANMTPAQRARATKTRSLFAAMIAMIATSVDQKADFNNAMRNFSAGGGLTRGPRR